MTETDSNRDAPATKGDLADLGQDMNARFEALEHRIETYWTASNRTTTIAMALIIAATVAIVLPTVAPYLPKSAPAVTGK